MIPKFHKHIPFIALIGIILLNTTSFSVQAQSGRKNAKITICHYPPGNPENVQSITIDESAWPAHEAHGDSMGKCRKKDTKNKISICHYPPGNPDNVQTITIDESAWDAHEAHGDAKGTCTVDSAETNPDNGEEPETGNSTNTGGTNNSGETSTSTSSTENNESSTENNESSSENNEGSIDETSQENSPETTDKNTKECKDSFSSTLARVSNSSDGSEICTVYTLTVNYSGDPTYALSHLNLDIPCGTVSNVSNSKNWAIVMNDGGPSGSYGFKVEDIEDFGDGDDSDSFTVNYTVCTSDLDCYSDCSFDLTYKAGQCLSDQTVSGNCSSDDIPTATITDESENIEVCAGEEAEIGVILTGNGPWTLVYTDENGNIAESSVESSNFTLLVDKSGVYSLVSIVDSEGNAGLVNGNSTVVVYEKPNISVSAPAEICSGDTAEIEFKLTGQAPWTVEYTDGSQVFTMETEESTFSITTDTGGDFEVTSVADAVCSNTNLDKENSSVSIAVKELPVAIIKGGDTICEGQNATLQFDLSGPGPYTVDFGNGTNNYSFTTDENYHEAEVEEAGTYIIQSVNNGSGCVNAGEGEVIVTKISPIVGEISVFPEYCDPDQIIVEFNSPNGTDEYEITWDDNGADGDFENTQGKVITYNVSKVDSVINFTASIRNQCQSLTFEGQTTIVRLSPEFLAQPSDFENYKTHLEYTFEPAIKDDLASYEWTFNEEEKDYSQVAYYTFRSSGEHKVSLIVSKIIDNEENNGLCSTSLEKTISILANRNIFVPTVFNPESTDENNRSVRVFGEDISNSGFSFEIYNRWGQIVYKTSSFEEANNKGWDGTLRNKNQEIGVYTFFVRGKFNDGTPISDPSSSEPNRPYTGTVTLVK